MIAGYQVFACVGARPLAMGGAFVGVADDENATYWNPAGLTQIEDIKLTYTPTLYDRDTVNYDDFVSVVSPLIFDGQDYGNLGFSFVNSGAKAVSMEIVDKWYWLSYAKKLPIDFLDLSLGVNLRQRNYETTINAGWMIAGTSIIGPDTSSDNAVGLDLSLFWKLDKVSLGVLWQDVNEPEFDLFGERLKLKAISNLRPGISFRPDDKTIICAELYDVLGESEETENNLRLGIERWFDLPYEGISLAARLGGYNINSDSSLDKAVTGGLGIKFGPQAFAQDGINCPLTFGIDYTCMHWFDMPAGTDDFTHMLGFNVSVPFDAFGDSKSSFEGIYSENRNEVSSRRYTSTKYLNKDNNSGRLHQEIKQAGEKIKEDELKRDLERQARIIKKEREQVVQEIVKLQNIKNQGMKSQAVVDSAEVKRKQYYAGVYKKMNNYLACRKIPIKGSVDLFFTVREDGYVKDIRVSSSDYGLREIVEEVLSDAPSFPQIPEELDASQIDFQIKVLFG